MSTLMETLASRKKAAAPPSESLTVLPVLTEDHEGACGESCSCGSGSDEGGCCGG